MTEELYQVQLENGEAVLVRPLAALVTIDIQDAANAEYPDPDTTPFEPETIEHAANPEIEATMKRQVAQKSEGYAQAMLEVANRRWMYTYNHAALAGMVADTPEGKAVTIERLSERREAALRVVKNPPDDIWLQTVLYVLFTSWADWRKVYAIAARQLTQEALQKAAERFRGDVPGA